MFSSGTLTRSTSCPMVTKICSSPLIPYLHYQSYSRDLSGPSTTSYRPCHGRNELMNARSQQMENTFINALVRAGFCKAHSHQADRTSPMSTWRGPHHRTRRREGPIGTGSVRGLQTSVRRHKAPAQQLEVTREDFENLVDYYYEPPEASKSHLPYLPVIEEATLPGHEEPKTTTLVEDSVRYGLNEDDHLVLRGFMTALYDESFSHETIFERYNALPSPRIPHLSQDAIRKLLHRLSIIEQKTQSSMVRYLSVVDDVKAAGIPLTSGEWSSAIAFAGRCFVKVSAVEVESALHIWREMEHEAGVKGTHVTFNILFDIAAKAGKFVLAEMILMEMKKRGLRLNRFAHVGLIYYHGLRGDGDGVRKAYRDLVQAGEIVDTLVMNCVIAALARAGEPTAAYQVYERMKRMHAMQSGVELPALDWKGSRELGRLLAHAVAWYKDDPETRQKLQSEQSMAPNLRTYLILVGHYAVRTGELDRVAVLLDEMRFLGVPLHGSILLALLKGFTIHGGVRYTPWSKARLEGVWSSLQRALDRNLDEIFLGKWMVIWILRAFAKCSGKDRMREVWEEIQSRWEPTETDTEAVNKVLHEILGT